MKTWLCVFLVVTCCLAHSCSPTSTDTTRTIISSPSPVIASPTPSLSPSPSVKTATFKYSNLIAKKGSETNSYSFYVDVQNTGDMPGLCEIWYKIDGVLKKATIAKNEPVNLNPGEKRTVSLVGPDWDIFILARDYDEGKITETNHAISIQDLSVTVTLESSYKLALTSVSFERSYGYITIKGEVKNISNQKLEDVLAVVNFSTTDGTPVKTEDALIEYDILMPGQTSPFKIIGKDNPLIQRYRVHFRFLMGSTIKHRDESGK